MCEGHAVPQEDGELQQEKHSRRRKGRRNPEEPKAEPKSGPEQKRIRGKGEPKARNPRRMRGTQDGTHAFTLVDDDKAHRPARDYILLLLRSGGGVSPPAL